MDRKYEQCQGSAFAASEQAGESGVTVQVWHASMAPAHRVHALGARSSPRQLSVMEQYFQSQLDAARCVSTTPPPDTQCPHSEHKLGPQDGAGGGARGLERAGNKVRVGFVFTPFIDTLCFKILLSHCRWGELVSKNFQVEHACAELQAEVDSLQRKAEAR